MSNTQQQLGLGFFPILTLIFTTLKLMGYITWSWWWVFGAPPKPAISKQTLCDWLEDNFDIADSQRDAFAADFAYCCDCIVKVGG